MANQCQTCGKFIANSRDSCDACLEESDSFICPHCNETLENGFRFCPFCGNEVG